MGAANRSWKTQISTHSNIKRYPPTIPASVRHVADSRTTPALPPYCGFHGCCNPLRKSVEQKRISRHRVRMGESEPKLIAGDIYHPGSPCAPASQVSHPVHFLLPQNNTTQPITFIFTSTKRSSKASCKPFSSSSSLPKIPFLL